MRHALLFFFSLLFLTQAMPGYAATPMCPAAPGPLTITATSGTLVLTWPRYQQGVTPATQFVVSRAVNTGGMFPYTAITNLGVTQYNDRNVRKQKIYCYTLQAVSTDGWKSAVSNRVCAKPRR